MTLLEVKGLTKHFIISRDMRGRPAEVLHAVDGVSFTVGQGEVFGLVGESGCGKTTIGKMICGVLEPTAGEIWFDGQDITNATAAERRRLATQIQFIFQDPYGSLNPRMTVRQALSEPLIINKLTPRGGVDARVDELLDYVGLSKQHKDRYPHEFSGGQRQRIGIARALALKPRFLVCDEPVSALDVSVQAQVLNLLSDLKDELGLTYIFIAHGLNVIQHLSDRVAVMYLGRMMELASKDEIYKNARCPYTRVLISAIPIPDPEVPRSRIIPKGDMPSPINPPPGCRFAGRCYMAGPECEKTEPELRERETGHYAACLFDNV